tara:strand:+ start:80 stop:352 length:273 start_codon:yes stop_codon:yes gene_type:complete
MEINNINGYVNHLGNIIECVTISEIGIDTMTSPSIITCGLITSGVYGFNNRYFKQSIYNGLTAKVYEYTKDKEGFYNYLKTLTKEEYNNS